MMKRQKKSLTRNGKKRARESYQSLQYLTGYFTKKVNRNVRNGGNEYPHARHSGVFISPTKPLHLNKERREKRERGRNV